jgi:iron complex outermembrane recepter protein
MSISNLRPNLQTCAASAVIAFLSLAPAAAMAQDAAPQTAVEETASDDIVVTAQKRSERLQDVPISISAIGGDALQRQRVTSADDLVTKIPNLQLTSTVGDNTPIFALRGVSMSDYSLNQASPVATYYDEVYKGNFALLGVAMYDLERVEVLRGPQGTLYGKNTTGGAVNLISRTPQLGETEGYVNLGYGNYNRIDANGAVSVPLGETLAARVAFTFARADGWFKNQLPGKPDLASVREYGIRGSLLFEPTDGVRFILRGSTSYQNPRNYGIYAQPEAINRFGLKRREIEANVTDRRRARTYSVSLTGNIDVSDSLAITSVTSWDKGSLNFYEDTDGTASQLLEIPYGDRAKQFAQDLRLTSDFSGPFNFILGAITTARKFSTPPLSRSARTSIPMACRV